MLRTVINIDEDLCTGCGLCVDACHEGAIQLNAAGKAFLARENFCDGLGDCLPACPTGAITFVEREAAAYDEAAVIAAQMAEAKLKAHATMPAGGCPGSQAKAIKREAAPAPAVTPVPATNAPANITAAATALAEAASSLATAAAELGGPAAADTAPTNEPISELAQWPCQIKLVPPTAPYFEGCDLLIAADCCAFAYANFHREFIKGRICIIGCPKLDGVDYTEKLMAIVANNTINSITVCRMQVPCCSGIDTAARRANDLSGKNIPLKTVIFGVDGEIVSQA